MRCRVRDSSLIAPGPSKARTRHFIALGGLGLLGMGSMLPQRRGACQAGRLPSLPDGGASASPKKPQKVGVCQVYGIHCRYRYTKVPAFDVGLPVLTTSPAYSW